MAASTSCFGIYEREYLGSVTVMLKEILSVGLVVRTFSVLQVQTKESSQVNVATKDSQRETKHKVLPLFYCGS